MLCVCLKLGQLGPWRLRCLSKGTKVLPWRLKFQHLISSFVHCIPAMGISGNAWLRTDVKSTKFEVLDHSLKLFFLEHWSCWFFFSPFLLQITIFRCLAFTVSEIINCSSHNNPVCVSTPLCHDKTMDALLRLLASFWATMGNLSQTLFCSIAHTLKKSMHKHFEIQDQGCSLQDGHTQGTLWEHTSVHIWSTC